MTCSGGTQIRQRETIQEAEYGGKECFEDESFVEERECPNSCHDPSCEDECCPGTSLVEICSCKDTCLSKAFPSSCEEPEECIYSCECENGLLMDIDGNCVTEDDCPCLDVEGNVYAEGDIFITPDQCEKW